MSDNAEIARQLAWTLGWIVAGGALLIGVARVLSNRKVKEPPAGEFVDVPLAAAVVKAPLWVRLGTLLVLAALLFVPAYFGTEWWAAVVVVLVAVGLGEFWAMLRGAGAPPHRWTGWLAGVALPAAALYWGAAGLGPTLTAGLLAIAAVALFTPDESLLPARLGGTTLGVLYVGLLGAHLVLVGREGGFGALVFFLMVVQLADVGGLMGGVLMGRHKMAPTLSPNKTWEGTLTGFAAAVGAAWAFAFAMPGTPLPALALIAVALAAAGLVGDLLASGLKRAAGMKDFGNALPGHGGVLDRFDGYLYAAPVFCAALWVLQGTQYLP
jgi:phosphatidate cytidylyltransferase